MKYGCVSVCSSFFHPAPSCVWFHNSFPITSVWEATFSITAFTAFYLIPLHPSYPTPFSITVFSSFYLTPFSITDRTPFYLTPFSIIHTVLLHIFSHYSLHTFFNLTPFSAVAFILFFLTSHIKQKLPPSQTSWKSRLFQLS